MATTINAEYEAPSERGKSAPALRWMLVSLSLSMLTPSLDASIANAGLPSLARSFNATFQEVQWIILSYLLVITALIVSAGRLGDIVGRRRLWRAGIILFTAASLLCGLAPNLWLLIAARAVQGIGAATMLALTVALVAETVPQEKIGRTMGLLGTMSAIGTTLGPSLGGVLIASLGWRSIFLINAPVGLLTIYLAYRVNGVRETIEVKDWVGFDYPGTVLLALTLGTYALAMTLGRGQFSLLNAALLAASILGAAIFLWVERKSASPLIRWTMFGDPRIAASLGATTIVSTVMMTTLVVGPFYLFSALNLPATLAGLALSVGPLVATLAGIPAGQLVDRFGSWSMTLAGLTGIGCGVVTLSLLPLHFGTIGYLLPITITTASYALFQAANNTALMQNIRSEKRGAMSGMLSLARNLGLITGVAIMGAIFALAVATPNIATARPEVIASGLRATFSVAALLIAMAIAMMLGVRKLATPAVAAD